MDSHRFGGHHPAVPPIHFLPGHRRKLTIVEDKPRGAVIYSHGVDHLREQEIHRLEMWLRANYRVDEPESGLVLRDTDNGLPDRS